MIVAPKVAKLFSIIYQRTTKSMTLGNIAGL